MRRIACTSTADAESSTRRMNLMESPGRTFMASEKIAFITGGNKGLGFETARQLGQAGVAVVLGSRDLAKGQAAAKILQSEGIPAEAVQFDVTHPADFQAVYDFFDRKYGRLDILINNAGISREDFMGGNKTSTT
ncbi:MAG: SDR family NAD(P)-dependent oxidoreductase, partial [Acidobacteriaceae bacterium]